MMSSTLSLTRRAWALKSSSRSLSTATDSPAASSSSSSTLPPPTRQPLPKTSPPTPYHPYVYVPLVTLFKPSTSSAPLMVPLPSPLFNTPSRPSLLHSLIISHLASLRAGTASTKNRSEVNYSGKKIRPQKGTGKARLGSRGSPMLTGGGRAFGPRPKGPDGWARKVNRKEEQLGLRVGLSEKWRSGDLLVKPAQNGGAVVGASEDDKSQDSELDLEASVETLAWRAGIMKRDLIGGESATDEEEGTQTRPTLMGASVRILASEGDVTRGERWQSAKNHRKSYKLMRQHSQDDDAADHNAALSSEEEESFDLSFDSHSNASGSTPSLSPFAHSRRSTASSYGFPSPASNVTPRRSYRRSQDGVSLLSPPSSSLELGEGGRTKERRSWNGAHDSSRTGWRLSSLSAPDELSARADDSPPLPSLSTLPPLDRFPTTPRRIPISPGTPRHRTSIVRPSPASRPLSSTSDISSASEAGWRSSASLPSLKKKSSTSTFNRTSIVPPTSNIPSSATSATPSRRDSITSSTSSTRRTPISSPPPVPDPSLLPPSPLLTKPSLRPPTASKLPSRIGTSGSKVSSRLPSLNRQASTSLLRAMVDVDEFGQVGNAGGGKARTLPVPGGRR